MKEQQKEIINLDILSDAQSLKLSKALTSIQTTIKLINNYYLQNDSNIKRVRSLEQSLSQLETEANTNLNIIQALKSDINQHSIKKEESSWRHNLADTFSEEAESKRIIDNCPTESKNKVKKLLDVYIDGSDYILLSARTLYEIANIWYPQLLSQIETALRLTRKNTNLYKKLTELKFEVTNKYKKIASSMLLRLEALFDNDQLAQDDPLVYTVNKLIEWDAIVSSKIYKARSTARKNLLSSYYSFIQTYGDEKAKFRVYSLVKFGVRDSLKEPNSNADLYPTTTVKIEGIFLEIPIRLMSFIPKKKPLFGRGDLMRYQFFKEYQEIILIIKRAQYSGRVASILNPIYEVNVLVETLEILKTHKLEILDKKNKLNELLLTGKTKEFLDNWVSEVDLVVSDLLNKSCIYINKEIKIIEELGDDSIKERKLKLLLVKINQILELYSPNSVENHLQYLNKIKLEISDSIEILRSKIPNFVTKTFSKYLSDTAECNSQTAGKTQCLTNECIYSNARNKKKELRMGMFERYMQSLQKSDKPIKKEVAPILIGIQA